MKNLKEFLDKVIRGVFDAFEEICRRLKEEE
jgi:hypothetical protein